MTGHEAIQLIEYIPRNKIKACDIKKFQAIESLVRIGGKPDKKEGKFLESIYRYTNGGDYA